MRKGLAYFIATGCGVGYFPFASGTAGSLAALPFAFAAVYFGGAATLAAFAVAIYIAGTFAVMEVLKYTKHDPSIVVIDEVAGQLISLLPLANHLRGNLADWQAYAAAFVLFRLFDITKPWPAGYLDRRVINAHGVMLDDVAAGMYAGAVAAILLAMGIL